MSNILMMYLPSFLINMNGLKCLSCAFIPYPKHLYSAGVTDGSGYSLVFPFFLFTMTKGSMLNYHIGQLMGHTRMVTRFTSKHANKFLRVQHQLQKNGVIVLFTSRFLAVLRYIVPLAAGMLRLNAVKVYAVSLLSACAWAALYVGAVTGISAF